VNEQLAETGGMCEYAIYAKGVYITVGLHCKSWLKSCGQFKLTWSYGLFYY